MLKPARITTTVLFADICRSTYLFEELGDEEAAALISKILRQSATVVETYGGTVLRTKGDDILAIFEDPADAFLAALDIHAAIRREPVYVNHGCSMRIGVNSGPVLLSNGDLLGDTVNTAARLCAVAKAGQTITSSQTVDRLDELPAGMIRPLGNRSLKGKAGPVTLFEFFAADQEDDITQVGSLALEFPKSSFLAIRHGTCFAQLNYLLVRFLMGRAPECDLTLDHPLVSRHHAEIRYRNDEFVLTDFSTNGTELIINGRPRTVHHSQAALRGSGSIFLGRTVYNRKFAIAFEAGGGTRAFSRSDN